jgi:ABC-type methionine transport system ATPase subunit
MTLLSFSEVSKRFPDGTRWTVVLDRVSFEMEVGETVGVLASKQAGKTTLLRIAAGLEVPDAGAVCWDGQDLAALSASKRARLLRMGGIARAQGAWSTVDSASVLEYVSGSLYSDGLTMDQAEARGRRALEDVQAVGLRDRPVDQLGLSERVRVGLAHALVRQPRLLLMDEPAVFPKAEDARELYALLHSLRARFGFALLIASEEVMALRGCQRMLHLSNGLLYSTDSRRKVLRLPDRRVAGGSGGADAS